MNKNELLPFEEEPREIIPREMIGAEIALAKAKGDGYVVKTPAGKTSLERDIDFGVIPGTKQPTLLKAGAEKIVMAYGLLQHYTIEAKHEEFGDNPVMCYVVKCELVKIAPNGREYVFTTGYGSANTKEKRNGRNSAYDSANSCIKMAQKRALTSAALSISGLSTLFSQDMENETFVNANYNAIAQTNDPGAPLTTKQLRLLFALAGNLGLNAQEAKQRISDAGYASMKSLTQADFDAARNLFSPEGKGETDG